MNRLHQDGLLFFKGLYVIKSDTKICSKCGKEHYVSNFFKHKQTKDGLHSWCKPCCKSEWLTDENGEMVDATKE